MSPTQLSLNHLRKVGWAVSIVEHWNAHAKVRQDCYGFADLLACHINHGIALVQTTTASNMAARRKKIQQNVYAGEWKKAGGLILLHGWKDGGLREERL